MEFDYCKYIQRKQNTIATLWAQKFPLNCFALKFEVVLGVKTAPVTGGSLSIWLPVVRNWPGSPPEDGVAVNAQEVVPRHSAPEGQQPS